MSQVRVMVLTQVVLLLLTACTAQSAPPAQRPAPSSAEDQAARQTKVLTLGIVGNVQGFGFAGAGNVVGAWASASEIHSNALITSEEQTRKPIGQVAAAVPSLDDGTITLLPDNRVRVVYHLRPNVTWQDGVPLTAQDLVFSYRAAADPGLPFTSQARQTVTQMEAVEAPDDHTFVIIFKNPYYQAALLGPRPFWPYPRHLLEEPFDRYQASGNSDEFLNLPYWTTDYVHLGPFRLSLFDAGEGLTFTAYPGYFRGAPKLDVIRLRFFANDNTVFSNLLAGAVDLFLDGTLGPDLEQQITERWRATGEGTVLLVAGDGGRYVTSQFRPEFQAEPAILDPRVRAALYQALDRDAFAEAFRRPDLAAYGIRPPGDLFYDATRDALRRYPYDPDRARRLLQDLGWVSGGDSSSSGSGQALRNAADGRPFHTAVWSTPSGTSDQEVPIVADYWRRLGLEVDENILSAALARNNEYLAKFPGWETTGNRADAMLNRFAAPPSSPATRWAGNNRGGFVDARYQQLVNAYVQSLIETDQRGAILRLSDYFATELPALPLMYESTALGFRKGIIALDDVQGGGGGGTPYGLYSRNAHLWDRQA